MPRVITSLGGQESQASQIPVSLVRLEITGAEKRMHDLDVSLYLNPSTNAVSMSSGAGLLEFTPFAGLEVPQIDLSDEEPLGEVSLSLSNIDETWFAIMVANQYRDAAATIWQGNLVQAAGTSPFGVTFQGVITMWAGKLVHIQATRHEATIRLEPPDPFKGKIPSRTYSSPDFVHMRPPGSTFKWGGGEVVS